MTYAEEFSRIVADALSHEPYDPGRVLNALSRDLKLRETFAVANSRKHPYSLYDHTRMVCGVFEKYLIACRLPALGLPMFRLLLCLHDIGKPRALAEGQKHLQHAYTASRLGELRELLPVSTSDLATMQALVSDDAIGLLIRSKVSHEEAVQRVSAMADRAPTIPRCEFFGLLTLLYQSDAAAYTRAGFLLPATDFVAKPKLEHTFRQTENGLVFSAGLNRLLFSDETESVYLALQSSFC